MVTIIDEVEGKNGFGYGPLDDREVSNDAEDYVANGEPYRALIRLKGVYPILFHRYSVEAVEEKSKAAKGSKTKKEDNTESYLYRTESGLIGLAGNMLPAAIREAGRSEQDPRSPRKSMRDLLRGIVIPVNEVEPFLPVTKDFDYLSRMRAVVQRSAVSRVRPALVKGWEIEWTLDISSGEYLPPELLHKLCVDAGRFQGLADNRPTYGRFQVVRFEVVQLED